MGGARLRRDDALSDIVGSVLMLAVTVSLLAAAAIQVLHVAGTDAAGFEEIDLVVLARAGDDRLTLVHGGGPDLPEEDVRLVVTVGLDVRVDAPLGAPGATWRVGDVRDVALGSALAGGERVEVATVAGGRTLADVVVLVPTTGAPPASSGFGVTLKWQGGGGGSSYSTKPGTTAVLEATVAHDGGRKAVRSVTVNASEINLGSLLPLVDDGTRGDRMAGDGVWTVTLHVAENVPVGGGKQLVVTATSQTGATVTDKAVLIATDTDPVYNTALLRKAGFRMFAYSGSASSDKLTVHFKVQQISDPVTLDDATQWELRKIWFLHAPIKPGGANKFELKALPLEPGGSYTCKNTADVVKMWKAENETVSLYKMDRDALRFYFQLEYVKVGAGSQTFQDTVDSTYVDQYFVHPKNTPVREVKDRGFPRTFADCSM